MAPYPLVPARGPLSPADPQRSVARLAAAALLHGASRALGALAQRLVHAPSAALPPVPPQLEFHAEAGAPEGALYADGVLVALLPGVNRL
jgi:hypothetical protein